MGKAHNAHSLRTDDGVWLSTASIIVFVLVRHRGRSGKLVGMQVRLVIEAGKVNRQYFKDLLAYRELFLLLAWRDILVRYKQTIIGIAWSVLRPLLTMIVFTIVFGRLAKMPSDGAPYPILVFAALLPWQFFSNTVSEGGNSLISNASMISKVYFPRIIIPTTAMIVSLIDFLISILILSALMVWYQYVPTVEGCVPPAVSWTGRNRGSGYHLPDFRPQREVSRFSVPVALYHSIRALYFARWFQQLRGAREMAPDLLDEPPGRSDRWISLGDHW